MYVACFPSDITAFLAIGIAFAWGVWCLMRVLQGWRKKK